MLNNKSRIVRSAERVPALKKQLKELAIAKGPHDKLPTTKELCKLFGTSPTTLNDVLDQLESQKVVYRKQGSGIYVSPRIHRKTIAVVFNSSLMRANASLFWGTLLDQFATHAETRGQEADQDFEFYMTSPSTEPHGFLPEHVKRAVQAGTINGVVAISLDEGSAKWLLDQKVPCIAYAGGSKWTVTTSSEGFIQTGLQALVDQGCRRIEYWGLPRHDDNTPEWYEATCRDVEASFRAIGLEPPPTLVGPEDGLLPSSLLPIRADTPAPNRAYAAIKSLFGDQGRPRPDGMFVADDTMTSGLLLGLLELGVRVGEDIRIVSHANRTSPILFDTQRSITLLEFDPAEIAGAIIHLLDQAMADPDLPEVQISVPWRVRLPA